MNTNYEQNPDMNSQSPNHSGENVYPNPYSQNSYGTNPYESGTYYQNQNPYGEPYQQSQNPYSQPYQHNGYYGANNPNYGYHNPNNQGYGYYSPNTTYHPYQQAYAQHGPVKDIYNWILMVLYPISFIVSVIMVQQTFKTVDLESLMTGNYLAITSTGWYSTLSGISSILSLAMTVFAILDIVQLYKQNYPILGCILFTILFKPGYFLWRTHILQRKKTTTVLYTLFLVGLFMWYVLWVFQFTLQMVTTVS